MQIHLLELLSPSSLSRRYGRLKFELCMLVLSEIGETYWGADYTYRFFERAQAKILKYQGATVLEGGGINCEARSTALDAPTSLAPQAAARQETTQETMIEDLFPPEFFLSGESYSSMMNSEEEDM